MKRAPSELHARKCAVIVESDRCTPRDVAETGGARGLRRPLSPTKSRVLARASYRRKRDSVSRLDEGCGRQAGILWH